jgi:hypothetical protein
VLKQQRRSRHAGRRSRVSSNALNRLRVGDLDGLGQKLVAGDVAVVMGK